MSSPDRQDGRRRPLVLCVDFDGTITDYHHYRGRAVFDPPLPGAVETLQRFKAEGWRIIIYTTRGETEAVAAYLRERGIPFDAINEDPQRPAGSNPGKPAADVYLDDRAVTFRCDWSAAYRDIHQLLAEHRSARPARAGQGDAPPSASTSAQSPDPTRTGGLD